MPVRIVVALRPEHARAVPPPHNAPAVNAAFLRAVGGMDPALAAALHDAPRYKPFTLTPLLDSNDGTPTEPETSARFEVALLADELTAPVLAALNQTARYRIGTTSYLTTEVTLASAIPFPELAGDASTTTRWTFDLITPTSFATALDEGIRRERPWPDPERVFTNLADRWDAFAGPVALPSAARTVIRERLETSAGHVRIADHLVKAPDIVRHGAVGTVEFRVVDSRTAPPDGLQAVRALARFATFAGFGDRTALGMGHVRLHP